MTTVIRSADSWFANRLASIQTDVTAAKAFQTIYVPDNTGATVAIIGDVTHDAFGVSTGLTGYGLASHRTGSWVKL